MTQPSYQELTDADLIVVSGGGLKEIFQQAGRQIMDKVTQPSLLCNPDTALMRLDGTLTSDSSGCHRT
ncbi:hypothetical protein [Bradyrhizobium sp. BR 10261]|uniref:hypothetical protein n=1 Tax=Bradyrhizobium sp. BR 10261 TaxID=2749992 RepID=UPI001C64FD0C|nr:hypothetical protein [Bradyrhizobium sp. BR 10261]MBW7967453.1 hypothetical protein [Bradyrhizobium sp. BR 10261]